MHKDLQKDWEKTKVAKKNIDIWRKIMSETWKIRKKVRVLNDRKRDKGRSAGKKLHIYCF